MFSQDFNHDLKTLAGNLGTEDYLFPGKQPDASMTDRRANKILKKYLRKAGITKNAAYRTLRHCSGAHQAMLELCPAGLHEAGYLLRDIQVLMGAAAAEQQNAARKYQISS